jgi:hypothetical protein
MRAEYSAWGKKPSRRGLLSGYADFFGKAVKNARQGVKIKLYRQEFWRYGGLYG